MRTAPLTDRLSSSFERSCRFDLTIGGPARSVLRVRIAACLLVFALLATRAAALEIGERAPDFSLPDQHGKTLKLSDLRGKSKVVIAFYVMAFTPG